MAPTMCAGRTILIVERDLNSALAIQDRIVDNGGRVITAYCLERALILAAHAALSDAVIDFAMEGAEKVAATLHSRKIRYIFDASGVPGELEPRPDRRDEQSVTGDAANLSATGRAPKRSSR